MGVPAVYGGTIPAAIWHDYMTAAMQGMPVEDFVYPTFDGYTTGTRGGGRLTHDDPERHTEPDRVAQSD